MRQWHALMRKVLERGSLREGKKGVGSWALFAEMIKVPNGGVFPAVTTKRLAFKQVTAEMACFIRGDHSLEAFHAAGCTVWDGNGLDPCWIESDGPAFGGDLGRIYGVQWRDWRSGTPGGYVRQTDQLAQLIDNIKANPTSRRHVVTAWNPGELDRMCLPPCPILFQVFCCGDQLDMAVYQRSCDIFLGLPFDLAGYGLLQRLIARKVGLRARELTFFLGDAHIYLNHFEQVQTVLARKPMARPQLFLDPAAELFDFSPAQAMLVDYASHPAVAAPLNV